MPTTARPKLAYARPKLAYARRQLATAVYLLMAGYGAAGMALDLTDHRSSMPWWLHPIGVVVFGWTAIYRIAEDVIDDRAKSEDHPDEAS